MTGRISESYVLDFGAEGELQPLLDIGARWKPLAHAPSLTRGFILTPGELLRTPPVAIGRNHALRLRCMPGLPAISSDGLQLELLLERDGLAAQPLAALWFDGRTCDRDLALELSLSPYAGRAARLAIRCLAGPADDPDGDWLALLDLAVAPHDRLSRLIGTAHYPWRVENERGRFAGTYAHPLYADRPAMPARAVAAEVRPLPSPGPTPARRSADLGPRLDQSAPLPGESAFAYAQRLLAGLIPSQPPDFAGRLRAIAAQRQPRVLSLCSGEAGIEAQLLRDAGCPVDLTLLDLDRSLLERAANRLGGLARLRLWAGDIRGLHADLGPFDVVCFVSSLHHVAHLEEVLDQTRRCLVDSGELWLVGEQIGRNGNRLWPDAQARAAPLFRALPVRLRMNHSTGRLDEELPDIDCASGCLEGIRSQDIPEALARYFSPVQEDRRNCFLWRFMEVAYAANYDLSRQDDLATVRRLVAEEFAFWCGGGLGTELNGVYRPKPSP